MQREIKNLTENNLIDVYNLSREQFKNESWTLSQFKDCLINKNYICYVAIQDNEIASFLVAQDLIDSINLLLVATKETDKKTGLGSDLINKLLEFSSSKKVKTWLEVKKTNTPAINLYNKHGFNILYERKNYYNNGVSALIMGKVLVLT